MGPQGLRLAALEANAAAEEARKQLASAEERAAAAMVVLERVRELEAASAGWTQVGAADEKTDANDRGSAWGWVWCRGVVLALSFPCRLTATRLRAHAVAHSEGELPPALHAPQERARLELRVRALDEEVAALRSQLASSRDEM